ncbi:MAG: LAGLIDADG family homing endonuclease [Nanoarchaeota archaeon]
MKSRERRIKLKKGVQREIILEASKREGNMKKMAAKVKVPYSTMKNYSAEYRFLPENLFNNLLKLSNKSTENIDASYLDYKWGQRLGGKLGIRALEKKYPGKIKKWRSLAMKKALRTNPRLKKINLPKISEELAEFIGIYLGDGTMTTNQIRIVGDARYDVFYFEYISKMVYHLFGLKTSLIKHKDTNTFLVVVYSKALCEFMNQNFNLKPGDKIRNQSGIPQKIFRNINFAKACLRGLIDTDGSVSRRGRNGSQFCIQFTSHNKKLLGQVKKINKRLKIFTFGDETGTGTNKWENIVKYFQIVGSSNPKHIVRFLLRKEGRVIYRDELSFYFKQERFKDLNLPFNLGGV